MQKVKFKDVAHLYMGCEMLRVGAPKSRYNEIEILTISNYVALVDVFALTRKPILRQFKDISKAELMMCFDLDERYPNHKGESKHLNIESSNDEVVLKLKNQHNYEFGMGIKKRTLPPFLFKYLLSIGIDLFNLIENGEAIDKTKL